MFFIIYASVALALLIINLTLLAIQWPQARERERSPIAGWLLPNALVALFEAPLWFVSAARLLLNAMSGSLELPRLSTKAL
jgi:nitric oxide reductase large subunit